MTQRQQAIDYWNSLTAHKRSELSLDYFGSTLIWDEEVEEIWLKECPQEKLYTREEVHQLFEKLVVRNTFKFDRDYEIAKKTLLELTGIDYEAEIN